MSPLTIVLALDVLWLVVVVPMALRRHEVRRRQRGVNRFGRGIRVSGRRSLSAQVDSRVQVFQPSQRLASAALPTRRPMPAAQEALMYPSEMSEARQTMLARRRRSLSVLGVGSVIFGGAALVLGGILWLLATPFLLGLAGYLYFLRSQALRHRERHAVRQGRASEGRGRGFEETRDLRRLDEVPTTVVRIDDDDIELHNLDTVDLTGLYNEEAGLEVAAQRRAS